MSELAACDVRRLIDERPVGAMQIRTVALCGTVALLDGLDLQAIGLAAPSIARALHVEPRAFGAVFSAALLGSFAGPLIAAALVARQWSIEQLYMALGGPGLVAAIFGLLLGLQQSRAATDDAPVRMRGA